jgi:16S rRNA (guanine(1405)-N(7))-methyltransferase
MPGNDRLDELVDAVRAGARYREIQVDLVRRIGAQELAKGRSFKDAVKETRNKLHQVGGAYQETPPDYARLSAELETLALEPETLREFCRRAMLSHASTRERLPYLEEFYAPLRARLGEVDSILDLACGLNPLALPWMPLAAGGAYYACDIYADMVAFLNRFFNRLGAPLVRGEASLCDLTAVVPEKRVKLALLLKTLPCLEQIDKTIGPRLLAGIRAEHLLVSFPALSLGGRGKGMLQNYSAHFEQLIAGQNWRVEQWQVKTELVFLISGRNG